MASTPASPTPQILPSLPVKNSVLRQLNIADNALPHGVAHLKHKLLLSPFHTGSQESNICANSDFSGPRKSLDHWVLEFRQRLEGTIAKSSDPIETFKSLSYLDQIAFVCLAAGWRDCRAPNCLQYQSKLERVVPECDSWPGLRDFVLCITSCSLSAADKGRNETKSGLDDGWVDDNLLWRFRNHITACIVLTLPDTALLSRMWDITGGLSELYNLEETDESDSIGSPRSGASGPWGRDVSSKHCARLTPEYLTCRRQSNLTLHLRLGLELIHKHFILHRLMLLRFFTWLRGFEVSQSKNIQGMLLANLFGIAATSSLLLEMLQQKLLER